MDWRLALLLLVTWTVEPLQPQAEIPTMDPVQRADGYTGIWYSNQPSEDRYRYKYSGGLGTYCAKHLPLAIYAPAVHKTFFVYGGTKGVAEPDPLLIMAGCFDHATQTVERPVVVMEKGTGDAHHNPVLALDAQGYLHIFASAHGGPDGYLFRSRTPYAIDGFVRQGQREFTYPQPHAVPGHGLLFLFTKYTGGRELYASTSADGETWTPDRKLAGFGGHYQLSAVHEQRCATVFNWHPPEGGLNARTNLYYMETTDAGASWQTVDGEPLALPLAAPDNPARIRDYQADGLLVYLKDMTHDDQGRPVVLHLTSRGYASGPESGPRTWMLAHWLGDRWDFRPVTTSDHNYDMGSLYIDGDHWRVLAPTAPGPQAWCTGGEVELWESHDGGHQWRKTRVLTQNSPRNHTYVRRPRPAHPDFVALWADGDALAPSISRLYYANQAGDVWRLPDRIEAATAAAEPLEAHADD